MELVKGNQATLYYVYDPMCSWCWGYQPTWLKLRAQLERQAISVSYQLGGLAPDSSELMPTQMQRHLQQTWHKIHAQLGTAFNFDFWTDCQPRRSTYPACRAALIARDAGLEQAMVDGIQAAYYLQARNPSNLDTLITIATAIGLDANAFAEEMVDETLNQRLLTEINQVRELPVQGFPSLVLTPVDEQQRETAVPIRLDYQDWQVSYRDIVSRLNGR